MDLFGTIGVAFLGVMIAGLLFSRVILWLAICADVLFVQRRTWQLALSISLFHSGPWLLLLAAFFAYHVRGESWAPWFIGGLVGGLIVFAMPVAMSYPAMRAAMKAREKDRA